VSQVRRAGAGFRRTTLDFRPRIGAMLDAVAEGAGVPVDEIYAINGRTELLYGSAPDECTSLGVLDRYTASGHTILAQNWDWHPAQRPYTLLLATRDERGFMVATLAEAGMLAKAGVNSAGLGVCLNMLGCDRRGSHQQVPYHVLVRAALETDGLALALRAVCGMPRGASMNLLLGQACADWGGGEIVDVELVPGDFGVLHPVDGVIAHANHIETGLPVRDRLTDLGGSSYFRGARARRLLALLAGEGKIEHGHLATLLADHASYPNAICRHVDSRDPDDELSESVYSLLIDLDDRRLAVAAGPPCGGEYVWTGLEELFSRAARGTLSGDLGRS
jgi:isopenicillin-N N-acyltransferase-like protein